MKILIKTLLVCCLFSACIKEDLNTHRPIETDGTVPGTVSNIQVENGPGAAVISYSLPKNDNLQYVMAEYKVNDEVTRVVKSSRYTDTLRVDGFNDEGEYEVNLYSVSKSEVRSEPVTVKVHPTTPPFRKVATTLTLNEDFGGVNITFSNEEEAKIAVVIITRDNNGDFTPVEAFYTQTIDGYFSARGFDTTTREFGVYIRDRWNNSSDTLVKSITPWYEKMLDKSKFREYLLPHDQPAAWGWIMPAMWDGKIDEDFGFHTEQGRNPKPHRFTFDMGVVAKLSRFKILQRWIHDQFLYNHGDPREWNMWGTAETPNPDGSWDGWTLLMRCESKKPSNLPLGSVTDEDRQYARGTDGLGEEFTFPLSAPPVRYIRMEILKNWSNTDFFHVYEITFWGNEQ